MIDWQIQTLSQQSSLSGTIFEEGEEVICLLFTQDDGSWGRANIAPVEWDEFQEKENLLGKWTRRFTKKPGNEEQKQKLLSAEEFFLSLFEHGEASSEDRDRDILKHILALFLERKRILRRLGKSDNGALLYLHIHGKSQHEVPVPDWDQALIAEIHRHLEFLS